MNQRGFTYIELLIVLGVLLLFSAFFVIVVNPIQRFQEARDDTRETHLNTILLGIEQKLNSEGEWNCASLPTDKFTEIGTGPGMYDLYSCLTPHYLSKYLVDPKEGNPSSGREITDGLVGHWKFDEEIGTTAYDASGNENHGTLVGGPEWVDGKMGGALDFDGVDNYVNCGNDESLDITDTLTISLWAKVPAITGPNVFIGSGTDWQSAYSFFIRESNQISFAFNDNGTRKYYIHTVPEIDTSWHHFVASYNSGTEYVYLDNVKYIASSLDSSVARNFNTVKIGYVGGVSPPRYDGLIDDVRIYNRVLSEEEIQDLYNYEYSSKYAVWQNPVTKNISLKSIEDETKEVSTGAPEVALDFDGTNDYVDVGNKAPIGISSPTRTVAAWINVRGKPSDWRAIISPISQEMVHFQISPMNTVQAYFYGPGKEVFSTTAFNTANFNKWFHVLAIWDGTYARMYVNGMQEGISSAGSGSNMAATQPINIGRGYGSSRHFLGQISDVRIYNRALSAEEVEQLYKGYDIRSGLVGHWPLNEAEGETAYDRSGNGNNGTLLPAGNGPTWTTK